MFSWLELGEQLKQIIAAVIRFIKARRREEATIAFAALLLWFGYKLSEWLPKELSEFLKPWRGVLIGQVILYLAGLALLIYAFLRIKRLVWVEDLPPAKDRPSAIKGPMAFTEADGELFRKLGRESELQKLLGLMLDDQVLMVVIRGASGAGKTSLLRAGLKHILGDRVTFHYWEAVPTEPDKGLLRAIQEKWPTDATKPATLDELVNPADALGRQSHVIVLDQFEQLRGNKKIFGLLSQIIRKSKPPHRITWVIAFRREFSADWMDFVSPELERGFRPPQDVSLRLFTADQAREVIGQLVNESNLKDSIEQSVINNLVEAATVEGEVSPVDIGIGLLVLAELHERQSGKTFTIRDYQFNGGAEGLLKQYIESKLEPYSKEDQETILKAMLALRKPETNQRIAEGLTVDELAAESGAESRVLKTQLDRLSHRDTRLLETVTPADGSPMRYRLPHERLIPALYRLTGKLLAEVDQAKLKFQNAFQAWNTNNKQWRFLLRLKELRQVERYETQFPWGNDEQEKKSFLRHSQQRRKIIKVVVVIIALVIAGMNWRTLTWYPRQKIENYLYEVNRSLDEKAYYDSLSALQNQNKLKKLELTSPLDLERFDCHFPQSLEELSLELQASSGSIAGLTSLSKCGSLKKLTLDLSFSLVSNLEPVSKLSNLTQLTTSLTGSNVSNLGPLSKLSNLTQLTISLDGDRENNLEPLSKLDKLMLLTVDGISNVGDLEPLSKLNNRKQLMLNINGYEMHNLGLLPRLSNLTQLTLTIRESEAKDLELLSGLNNRTQLTLDLSGSRMINLEPLSKLSNLTQLTLDIRQSEVDSLEPLSKLSNLTQLTLYLNESEVGNLEPLSKLKNLKQLTLHSGWGVGNLDPLSKLSNLTNLVLDLGRSRVSSLEPLSRLSNLTQLELSIKSSRVSNVGTLWKLNNLRQLTIDGVSEVNNLDQLLKLDNLTQLSLEGISDENNLEPLLKLAKLTQLKLTYIGSDTNNLGTLSKLGNLTQLTLDLSRSYVNNLESLSKLANLSQLTLKLGDSPNNRTSEISNLEPLSKLGNLTQLSLDLSSSQVSNLEALSKLSNLTQLTLNLNKTEVSSLEPLSKLTRLKSLSIDSVTTKAQRQSLRNLPTSLVELKF